MEILGQIPSIMAFQRLGLPPIFEVEEFDPFGGAIESTQDSYDPSQQSKLLSAFSYKLNAGILSSSIYSQGGAFSASSLFNMPTGGGSSLLAGFGGPLNSQSSAVSLFLAPNLSLTETPSGPLSVGDLIDLFA